MKKTYIVFLCLLYFLLIFTIIRLFHKSKKPNNPQKKNLILGAVANYTWETIEPFFISMMKANFESCDYVMFISGLSNLTIEMIHSLGVKTYEIPENYNYKIIHNYRFKLFEEYLNNNIDKYNMVLCLDVRDSIFQKDLFKTYKNNKKPFIGIAIEDGFLWDACNRNWLVHQFGYNVYQAVKDERIVCSGTIWGTAVLFLEFIRKLWEVMNSELCNITFLDQSSTNYIVYYKKIFNDSIIKSDNNCGPVMTIGISDETKFQYDSEENLLTYNGEVAAVIHQYNRKSKITEISKRKFCSQTNISNVSHSNDEKSSVMIYILIILVVIIMITITLIFWGLRYLTILKMKKEKPFRPVGINKGGSKKNKKLFLRYRKIPKKVLD